MMKKLFISGILILGGLQLTAQKIDKSKSKVEFEIGNMGIKSVEGEFSGMTGTINFSPTDLAKSNFNVCIDASSVNTESEKRDDHLKNEDFFDVGKYAKICFVSNQISKTDKGYEAKGTLSMHGISLEITIPFTYANKTFKGSLELERLDYKIGEDYGGFMVGKTVEIQITCVVQ